MASRFSVDVVFRAIDLISKPMKSMTRSVQNFSNVAEKNLKRMDKTFGSIRTGIRNAALTGTLAFGAVSAVAADTVKTGADFFSEIKSAALKVPGSIEEGKIQSEALAKAFDSLRGEAMRLGATTEFTSLQMARGVKTLAKQGMSTEKILASMADIVDFATASELDFDEAASIAGDTLGAFGLQAKKTNDPMRDAAENANNLRRVMDVLALTANSANTDVAQLFHTVRMGGALSALSGKTDIETFSAIMGTIANFGVKATVAGTAAKNILMSLAGQGNKAKKTFKELKIDIADTKTGKLRDALDVFDDLTAKMATMTEEKRAATIDKIFGMIPLAAATKMATGGAAMAREMRKLLYTADGFTKVFSKEFRQTVKGEMRALESAVESVKIAIFSLERGALKDLIHSTVEWIRLHKDDIAKGISNVIRKIADNFDTIVKGLKFIGAGLAVFFSMSIVLKSLIGIFALLNLVMMANPISLLVGFVVAAIPVLISFAYWWDEIKSALGEDHVITRVMNKLEQLWGVLVSLKDVFVALPTWVKVVGAGLLALINPLTLLVTLPALIIGNWDKLGPFFEDLWSGIADTFTSWMDKIDKILSEWTPPWLSEFMGGVKLKASGSVDMASKGLEALKNDARSLVFGVGGAPNELQKSLLKLDRDLSTLFYGPSTSAATETPTVMPPTERTNLSIFETINEANASATILVRSEQGTSAEVQESTGFGTTLRLETSGTN